MEHEQPDPHFWQLCASEPCSWVDRPGNTRDVTKVSDFWSDRAWTGSAMFRDYGQRSRSFREIGMRLPYLPQFSMKLMCWRGPGRDFDERERLLLQLLRPHIVETWCRAERLRRMPTGLTGRQLELLEYVAQGLTNVQVAHRMSLSEGTVRTHLNHIYARLGVGGSRTAGRTATPGPLSGGIHPPVTTNRRRRRVGSCAAIPRRPYTEHALTSQRPRPVGRTCRLSASSDRIRPPITSSGGHDRADASPNLPAGKGILVLRHL